jgi:hypothetical protein
MYWLSKPPPVFAFQFYTEPKKFFRQRRRKGPKMLTTLFLDFLFFCQHWIRRQKRLIRWPIPQSVRYSPVKTFHTFQTHLKIRTGELRNWRYLLNICYSLGGHIHWSTEFITVLPKSFHWATFNAFFIIKSHMNILLTLYQCLQIIHLSMLVIHHTHLNLINFYLFYLLHNFFYPFH